MHAIKITLNLLLVYKRQIYQIAESNRIKKNRFDSENRIESNRNFFRPNWNALMSGRSDLDRHRGQMFFSSFPFRPGTAAAGGRHEY